jgi:hypothetical protein
MRRNLSSAIEIGISDGAFWGGIRAAICYQATRFQGSCQEHATHAKKRRACEFGASRMSFPQIPIIM